MRSQTLSINKRRPVRQSFLPFHSPVIAENEISAVVEVLKSGWLTTGAKVQEFERSFGEFIGCRHAVAFNSGTAALHLALAAIGIQRGEEVLLPTTTVGATAEVVRGFGTESVLIACGRCTLHIGPG